MNDLGTLARWVGRETKSRGRLTAELVDRFQATLELTAFDADALPVGIHWCVGLEAAATSELGPDGHPPRGGFLPPVPYPRRMWASGKLDYLRPLRTGEILERRSRIAAVEPKSGRSGRLCFVTVSHEVAADGEVAIRETQNIVFREATPGGGGAEIAPRDAGAAETPPPGSREARPSEAMLFRYSALTFNAHRIHYDLPYARAEEGYPGLVVHGPLQATLLADHAARELGRPLGRFTFRGQGPAFAGVPLTLRAEPGEDAPRGSLRLRSEQSGRTCMTAEAA